ncbi:6-phosphogluconolactonase [Gaoshiqia sp. Z1-71]|uniref:6-phosphogluconolactonase n=1 Tax=Gaoshiqia hydrogeniformans TaxID=3290090 RepID=UPI003BF808F1
MTTIREIKRYANPDAVAEAFAAELYQWVKQAKKPVHIALSGGTTPALLFDVLARDYATKMPWKTIHFWWGDERCVAPTDAESNYKMANDHLFSKIQVNPELIHRVKGELPPEESNNAYRDEIEQFVQKKNDWPAFGLIILGLGNDGHTASVFPHQMELLESDRTCALATHPESGQKRVTLTGKVINNAERVFFLVTGKSKAGRMAELVNQTDEAKQLPAYYISPKTANPVFFLDYDAASELGPED